MSDLYSMRYKENNVSSSWTTMEWQSKSYNFDNVHGRLGTCKMFMLGFWTKCPTKNECLKETNEKRKRKTRKKENKRKRAVLYWISLLLCFDIFNAAMTKKTTVKFFNRVYKTYNASPKLLEGVVTKREPVYSQIQTSER